MNKILYPLSVLLYLYISLLTYDWISQKSRKSELKSYYLEALCGVKERLMYGSSVDTKEELEQYEDNLTLYMHLDGFDAKEVLELKVKAVLEVSNQESKK